jgi:hypothetical protein
MAESARWVEDSRQSTVDGQRALGGVREVFRGRKFWAQRISSIYVLRNTAAVSNGTFMPCILSAIGGQGASDTLALQPGPRADAVVHRRDVHAPAQALVAGVFPAVGYAEFPPFPSC